MKRHHRVVARWIAQRARDREAFLRGDPSTYRGWFNSVDHRSHRILDAIFFAAELHGLVPHSHGRRDFYFECEGSKILCVLGQTRNRASATSRADLNFALIETRHGGTVVPRIWSDGPTPLERQIPEIVATLAAEGAAAAARRRITGERAVLPALLKLADQHRSALRLRQFLRSLLKTNPDPSVEIDGHPLQQWISWSRSQIDELDPVTRGAQDVVREVAANSKLVRRT